MVKAWSVQCTVAGSVSENPAGAGSHRPASRPPGHVSPAPRRRSTRVPLHFRAKELFIKETKPWPVIPFPSARGTPRDPCRPPRALLFGLETKLVRTLF